MHSPLEYSEPPERQSPGNQQVELPILWERPKTRTKSSRKQNSRKRTRARKKIMPNINQLSTSSHFTSFDIPPFLQDSYLNGYPEPIITQLRPWQQQLFFMPEWKEGKSAVVLVPTSGGKTLIADVAIAQCLERYPNAKAIFALPFVALANEKYSEYQKRFPYHSVRPYYQNIGGSEFRRGSIAICTYEKVHGLLNSAFAGGYSDDIKIIVIDEVHMLGDQARGPGLEALIVKALSLPEKPRILALTATISQSDAKSLASWIGGFSFSYGTRNTEVEISVARTNGEICHITKKNSLEPYRKIHPNTPDDLFLHPIREQLAKNPQSTILVFTNFKKQTVQYALRLSATLTDKSLNLPSIPEPSAELKAKRLALLRSISSLLGIAPDVYKLCILAGVMFHNAGLLLEERKLIEAAARERVVSVLVATTTLSAGVNIHSVNLVIVHNIFRWVPEGPPIRLLCSQFLQMIGRAGRTESVHGEAIVIEQSGKSTEEEAILELASCKLEALETHLHEGSNIDRYVLQGLSVKMIEGREGVQQFINRCYYCEKNGIITADCIKRLEDGGFIVGNPLAITSYGSAVAGSSLSIEEGEMLNFTIMEIQRNLCLDDDVHLLFMCVPPGNGIYFGAKAYNDSIWLRIFKQHSHVIQLILNQNEAFLKFVCALPDQLGGNGRGHPKVDDQKLDRIYSAVILSDLINEKPMKEISKEYDIEFGTLQSLQMQSAAYAGQTARFCELYGATVLAAALNKFRQRLSFASRNELISLMSIPSCNRRIARKLFDSGIQSPMDLAGVMIERLVNVVMSAEIEANPDISEDYAREIAKKLHRDSKEFATSWSLIDDLETDAVLTTHNG